MITAFDYDLFMVSGFSLAYFCMFYYAAVFLPSGLFNLKRCFKLISFSLCTIICITGTVVFNVVEAKTFNVYVVGSQTISATLLSLEGENTLIVSSADAIFSASRLKRLSDKSGITDVDCLIVTSGCASDVQNITTKLNKYFKISKICYYGKQNKDMEMIIMRSFGIEAIGCENNVSLPVKTSNCTFDLKGYAVNVEKNGKILTVFSRFGKYNSNYDKLNINPDCIIAFDYCFNIYERYKKVKTISYLEDSYFINGQKEGTLKLDFDKLTWHNV